LFHPLSDTALLVGLQVSAPSDWHEGFVCCLFWQVLPLWVSEVPGAMGSKGFPGWDLKALELLLPRWGHGKLVWPQFGHNVVLLV
jgi:hypothetical protein